MSNAVRRYLIMTVGSLLIGVGVAAVIAGDLGSDSMTTLEQGISRALKIDMSLAPLIANGLFILALLAVDRSRVSIDTIICPFQITLGIKLANLIISPAEGMFMRIVCLVAGYLIIALGIGVGAQSKTGSNPYDGFVLALAEKLGWDYRIVRWALDIAVLLIGVLLGGSFGIGTFYAIALTGVLANFFINLLKKRLNEE
ncbi:MAG: hypothetical protein K6A14_00525 [Erysipelotrichaceae bacterium]|nr:hypothetical protein [Erysipelotrichaceae bacterium]